MGLKTLKYTNLNLKPKLQLSSFHDVMFTYIHIYCLQFMSIKVSLYSDN